MKTTASILILLITILFSSCGLRPIPSEHTLVQMDKEQTILDNLGNGKILIYNDANILHTSDKTDRLNIKMDGRNLGQLRAKDYVIVNLVNGKHTFDILHLDLVNMKSDHEVTVTDTTKVIMVKPTITSNKLKVTNQLPDNWNKYSYMK
ncbi:hypothetical protein [Salinimicrobium terrae]|uniref:hypothetical protein n=1 Tax=Salinimicrobium terrae TaxID=470866 RepID=UPI0003FD7A55|nr:hypothetical protein [Salinimicrobium terrae]